MSRPPALIVFGFLSAVTAGATSATTFSGPAPSTTVQYPANALNTDAGARALYRQLVAAAEKVCPEPVGGGPFINAAEHECREAALERAVSDVNNVTSASNERRESGTGDRSRDGSRHGGTGRSGHRRGQRRAGCREA